MQKPVLSNLALLTTHLWIWLVFMERSQTGQGEVMTWTVLAARKLGLNVANY